MDNLNKNNHHELKKNKADYISDELIKVLVKRKFDFIAGKTTSRSWNEIKKNYLPK